jgi:hypothetical protein
LLLQHKAGVVALLRAAHDGWSAKDWLAFFDERAGIAEFDGGLPRADAEARAFACCVAEWLNRGDADPLLSFETRKAEAVAALAEMGINGRTVPADQCEPCPEPKITKDPYFAFGADQVPLPENIKFQRARGLVRAALKDAGIAQKIDALAARLLGHG